jgi:NAD(P)-dependent dehydrogenase (short-subunit alcohol dehydrogenase family)
VHYGPAGIRVNCIVPEPFPNPAVQKAEPAFIHELGRKTVLHRIGQSHEIVGPILLLLADSPSFATGQSIVMDEG